MVSPTPAFVLCNDHKTLFYFNTYLWCESLLAPLLYYKVPYMFSSLATFKKISYFTYLSLVKATDNTLVGWNKFKNKQTTTTARNLTSTRTHKDCSSLLETVCTLNVYSAWFTYMSESNGAICMNHLLQFSQKNGWMGVGMIIYEVLAKIPQAMDCGKCLCIYSLWWEWSAAPAMLFMLPWF